MNQRNQRNEAQRSLRRTTITTALFFLFFSFLFFQVFSIKTRIEKDQMKRNETEIRYSDLERVCFFSKLKKNQTLQYRTVESTRSIQIIPNKIKKQTNKRTSISRPWTRNDCPRNTIGESKRIKKRTLPPLSSS